MRIRERISEAGTRHQCEHIRTARNPHCIGITRYDHGNRPARPNSPDLTDRPNGLPLSYCRDMSMVQ